MGGLFPFMAHHIKEYEKKETEFWYNVKSTGKRSYNKVGGNIYSERVDLIIETDYNLDFQIKDKIRIKNNDYIIHYIPEEELISPFSSFSLKTLELIKVASRKETKYGV